MRDQAIGLTKNKYRDWALLALPAIIVFVVGLQRTLSTTLWVDELATWSASRRSWSELFHLLENVDVVHTLYYAFMHVWLTVFGESQLSLRMPSTLAMATSAILVVLIGRRLFDMRSGVYAGLLFSVLPAVANLAYFARGYAFMVLLALSATYVLIGALERSSWSRWLAYAVLIGFAGIVQIFTLLLLVGHLVMVVQQDQVSRRRVVLWWSGAVSFGLLLCAPVIWLGSKQRGQITWIPPVTWSDVSDIPGALFGSIVVAIVVIGLAFIGLRWAGRWGIALITWGCVPAAVLFLVSIVGDQSYWMNRYVCHCIPAFVLLAGLALSKIRLRYVAPALAVAVAVAVQPFVDLRDSSGVDAQGLANYLDARAQRGDVAMYHTGEGWAPRDFVRFYVPSDRQPTDALVVKSVEETGGFTPEECPQPVTCLAGAQRVWLIRIGNHAADPAAWLPPEKESLLRQDFTVKDSKNFEGISVALFQRRS